MFFAVACVLHCLIISSSANDFTYKDVSKWSEKFVGCSGSSQSPIDIVTKALRRSIQYEVLTFSKDFAKVLRGTLLNNGHTVQFDASDEQREDLILTGGPLGREEYRFVQLHFHWGANDSRGSEHTVNGVSYAGELHLVHFNTKYGSPAEAIVHKDGLAVIGLFLETTRGYEPHNPYFQNVASAVAQLSLPQSESKLSLIIQKLFESNPVDFRHYFTYTGSLTTPGCSEIVTWIVFATPLRIKSKELHPFRALIDSHGARLVDNFRPAQPANGRVVSLGGQHRF